jgi:hypothetical protein
MHLAHIEKIVKLIFGQKSLIVCFVCVHVFSCICRKKGLDLDQSYLCSAFLGFDFLLLYDFVHRQQSECCPAFLELQARQF